jgi:hypothetical protein
MGEILTLRKEAPALAAYRVAERAKSEAAAKVFDAMLLALSEAEARCGDAASIDLPPGIRDLARRIGEQIAEGRMRVVKLQGGLR